MIMNILKKRSLTLLATTATCALLSVSVHAQEIVYTGDNGPSRWASLNAAWEACAGTSDHAAQSPVNVSGAVVDSNLTPLQLETFSTTIDIFNNGHAIEQRYEGTGSEISFDGVAYELLQFHFHTLSEHTFSGTHAPLEMHAVFGADSGAILVVGQVFEITSDDNPNIQMLIDAGLPAFDGDETMTADSINIADLLTDTSQYYTYSGSLTTPPCSEVVTWVLLKNRAPISSAQYAEFRDILGNNFRPLQALNNRVIRATAPNNAADCDYTAADLNNGWGWNPNTRTSCPPLDVDVQNCDYSAADQNDGWGWNPVTGDSCPPRAGAGPLEEGVDITLRNTLQEGGAEGSFPGLFGLPDNAFDEFATLSFSGSEFPAALAQSDTPVGDISGLYDINLSESAINFTLLPTADDPFWVNVFEVFPAGKFDRYYLTFSEPHNISSFVSSNSSVRLRIDSDTVVVVEISEGYDMNPGMAFRIDID